MAKNITLLGCLLATLAYSCSRNTSKPLAKGAPTYQQDEQNTKPKRKTVRFVYLVSADRILNEQYLSSIENAALNVQQYYHKQMNGVTFTINKTLVEIAYSNKNADFFYSNPSDSNPDNWGFFNAFNEVKRILGAKFNDKKYVWVIYSDGPGNKGRGGSGVCVMPEDDLLGLSGLHPTQPDINRWIGGLAHELGHAFGLEHPKDTAMHKKAVMWTGIYGYYPNEAYLTEEDKSILKGSSFFSKKELEDG